MRPSDLGSKRIRLGQEAHQPNTKSPWAGRIKGGVSYNEDKDKAMERHVNKWRVKQALRTAGLHHSFFTKKLTKCRKKNWHEALAALPNNKLRKQAREFYG